ncbi:MAG: type I-E CRISPR-associated protein Cse1/CasA [Pyrinomonadaceae bacterium]
MPEFNLIEQPWLPCLRPDGRAEDLSLRDVLTRAHELREMFDSSPLVTVALHRFLLALLHRAHDGPTSIEAWRALWSFSQFDAEHINRYLDQWSRRFDLFDVKRPFYQMRLPEDVKAHPVQALCHETASGNNPTLFDHSHAGVPLALTPAAAARQLIAFQSFALGGGVSQPFNFSDAMLARGYTLLAQGDNLFETLMLNLLVYTNARPFPRLDDGGDQPAWEVERPPTPDRAGTQPRGYVDYLTFQSRRVCLLPDSDGTVRRCQIQQNLKLPEQGVLDPFKAYKRDEKTGFRPFTLQPAKALWRDSHALFEEVSDAAKRPDIFNHLARVEQLRRDGKIEARPVYSFAVYGLATEPGQNLVHLWQHERLPLPLGYLTDAALRRALRDALFLAEETAKILHGGARTLARYVLAPEAGEGGEPDKDAVKRLVESFRPGLLYWPRLEPEFRQFLVQLAEDREEDEDGDVSYGRRELPHWAGVLERRARGAFREMSGGVGTTARTLKAAALSELEFGARMHALMKKVGPTARAA